MVLIDSPFRAYRHQDHRLLQRVRVQRAVAA